MQPMQKHKSIKAFFFLGIFSMLLLHQVVPHLHHQHDVENTHHAGTHDDNHHHDDAGKENSEKGFLDFFFGTHAHTVVSNDIFVAQERSVKQVGVKKDVKTTVSLVHSHRSIIDVEIDNIGVYHPPSNYFNRHLTCSDSRGPPTLG